MTGAGAPIPPPDLTDEPEAVREAVYAVILHARSADARTQALRQAPPQHRERVEQLVVYDLACAIALEPDKERRRQRLQEAPAKIRGRVEVEARRLWRLRGV